MPQQGKDLDAAIEAEITLLGGLLVNAERFDEAQDLLSPADFFRKSHQLIFDTMLRLASEGGTIDPFTVQHALSVADLEIVGKAYLFDIISGMPSGLHVASYAKIVREYAIRRELASWGILTASRAQSGEQSAEELLLDAESTIDRLRGRAVRIDVMESPARANAAFAQLEEISLHGGLRGVTTGLTALDTDLRGLHPGNLIIIGARPSQGKTCLGLTMAMAAAASTQRPALFFSIEMSSDEINMRELSMRGQVDNWKLNLGKLSQAEYPRVVQALEDLREGCVHVVSVSMIAVNKIRVLARRARAKSGGLSVIVIDYLQLLDDGSKGGENRAVALGEISRGLKILAREMDVPVVALSQLNRKLDDRPDRRPRLSDLRESGSLEQDADVVLLLHRPCVYFPDKPSEFPPTLAEIIIAKQRNGPTGTVEVEFIAEQTRFTDRSAA